MTPRTLLSLYGREPVVPSLAEAALVLIDYQNDYLKGPLELPDAAPAIAAAERVLMAARVGGTRIVHILQKGSAGGLFDRARWSGAPIEQLAPLPGETVIEKSRPSGFFETDLAARLGGAGTSVIFMGFMTHMCLSTTVRDALDYSYAATVVADACASRDLPGPSGVVPARLVHEANLAALGDRFAGIFTAAEILGAAP
ncbi:MAG TPA: isochorismatase family protein [Rhizomicrobium sp.]|nr:isochorismatase family protein [Rhizomicrobium sp.]